MSEQIDSSSEPKITTEEEKDPNDPTHPDLPSVAIGIDLGTTYSCVGISLKDGVSIVENEIAQKKTPSCVAFNDEQRFLGDGASRQALRNAINTIFNAKRLIGRSIEDPAVS